MKNWAAVVAHALTLPGAEVGTAYGRPAIKVRGKTIAGTTSPDPDSFVLHTTADEKAVLLETDPDTFWQTPHYEGWPVVLVRYGSLANERIAVLIERAWWDRAAKAQRAVFGDRP
ncbi:MmcQ/YjbR family DNA-binding protein [uncultured Sphingomonas sp.]|uniref:MmcQ/YjbR family DNA-binding protein n=1 Tax=uncultured Sphingomonas sp. TaxID=158754 RepID=UPI0025F87682|nr:MmcQ/YjbR family DNA-binding protein [uncultured Sphingomonas sp.]